VCGQGVIQTITSSNHYIAYRIRCRRVSMAMWQPPVFDDGDTYGLLPPASTFTIAFGFDSRSSPGCTPSPSPRRRAESPKLSATYAQNLCIQRHYGYGTLTCGGGYSAGRRGQTRYSNRFQFKWIQTKFKSFQTLIDPKILLVLKKLKYNMVLKGLKRGTTFSIGTSSDS
jgi:hypothetical protein